ncbi:phloretin 4'-O-glucosyltransferase-like [Humulus lupulus]|uniref:phloretin 4'-O-glucosyltransferase-like n=1 Tax=Humulus lupulus TaxID=3486 RepID=UPI002B406A33|nr:phloretin 4'-O-glucosyltransferase-like [Humulus lupulus]
MDRPRFMVMTYPAQGHINPALQFAKRLASIGADVTFVLPLSAYRRMAKGSGSEPEPGTPYGSAITFAPYSVDGYDDGFKRGGDMKHYSSEVKRCGSQSITDLVVSGQNDGRPYCCFVYTLLLPWAGNSAAELGLPSVMLWIQPATVFDVYYLYFNGYADIIKENMSKRQSHTKTTLPGLSLEFDRRDLPSFMDAEDAYSFILPHFQEQFDMISKQNHQRSILVNTFDELEVEALRAVSDLTLIGIGPLIPSAFLDENDPSDKSFGCDIFHGSEGNKYIDWLNSKPKTTVVYVSFGSILDWSKQQMEEIAKGLLSYGRPFLWVVREKRDKVENDKDCDEDNDELVSCREELEKLGMIVPWCSQLEVLSNESIGCFVTHCGWNSTLESLASGVPMVAFPKWSDQGTNAKLIEEEWKIGVRVKPNEDEIVESEEIRRCLELVMGKENEELRRNGKKWKDLAKGAVKEGGSSDKNLKSFVAQMNHIS